MSDIQYLPDPGLEAAVQVALELGMPLLVTGEPGTGKTQAAYWAAKHLGYLSAEGKRSIPLQKSVVDGKQVNIPVPCTSAMWGRGRHRQSGGWLRSSHPLKKA